MTENGGLNNITAILLGKAGHGKSTFCNLLSDTKDFLVGRSTHSITSEIKYKDFINEKNNAKIRIIDTPGFSDSEGRDTTNIKK